MSGHIPLMGKPTWGSLATVRLREPSAQSARDTFLSFPLSRLRAQSPSQDKTLAGTPHHWLPSSTLGRSPSPMALPTDGAPR